VQNLIVGRHGPSLPDRHDPRMHANPVGMVNVRVQLRRILGSVQHRVGEGVCGAKVKVSVMIAEHNLVGVRGRGGMVGKKTNHNLTSSR